MRAAAKGAILAAVLVALGAVIASKRSESAAAAADPASTPAVAAVAAGATSATDVPMDGEVVPVEPAPLPRMVDLGAGACIPCKKMKPILDELSVSHADRFQVVFIDVWKYPEMAEPYEIQLIPTQIFFAPDGEELYRHQGFFSREDILAKWAELGYAFGERADSS